MAITGIVTGILSIIVGVGIVLVGVSLFGESESTFRSYQQCIEETNDTELCDEQLEQDLLEQFGG